MRGKNLTRAFQSAVTVAVAFAATLVMCLLATLGTGVQLLANTLLVMGGNNNPAGLTPKMDQQIGGDPWYPAPDTDPLRPVGTFGQGYIDTQNNPASPYYGWDFSLVEWPAQIRLPILGGWGYEPSQQQGVHNIGWAINGVLPTIDPGETLVAFGYSSSANVMVREMRGLQNQPGGAPAADRLEFFLMANPNRPNGGIMQRFAGLYIPFIDIRLDGSTPVDTPYPTTDISWQYDSAADLPNYPLNLLAVLNSLVGGAILHGNYYPADINGARAFPDTTVGNITYITLKPPHLPLLMPLYDIGFPTPLLALVEPALTVMVDWGYDRSISPGTPTRARLIPRINPITAVGDLAEAVVEGVDDFRKDLRPAAPVSPASDARLAAAIAPSPRAGPALGSPRVTTRTAAAGQRRGNAGERASASAARSPKPASADRPQRGVRAASQLTGKQTATNGIGGQIEIGDNPGGGGGGALQPAGAGATMHRSDGAS